jgi:hypothetical protein
MKYENITPSDIIKITAIYTKWSEVWGEIEEICSNFHRNARLHEFPYEDEESEIFWDWLGWHCEEKLEDLSSFIYQRWGYHLDFYQTGRTGATIYPHPWCKAHHHYRGINNEAFYYPYECGDESLQGILEECNWLEYGAEEIEEFFSFYESDREKLEVLRFIQEYIKEGVKAIPEEWRKFKEANPHLFAEAA